MAKSRNRTRFKEKRKEIEAVRLKRLTAARFSKLAPFISEAETWRATFEAALERLQPVLKRDVKGDISIERKSLQIETLGNNARTFLEKYEAMRTEYEKYASTARAAGEKPLFYGEILEPRGTTKDLGQRIMLASVEAARVLKAIEALEKKH